MSSPLRIGISSCLLGAKVRWDGDHRHASWLDELDEPIVWVPVCPEVELGLGVPRPTLRLESRSESIHLVEPSSGSDLSDRFLEFASPRVEELAALDLDGYILKSKSPSCGLRDTRVSDIDGTLINRDGVGFFTRALTSRLPELPVEDETRLADPTLRREFVARIRSRRHARDLGGTGDPGDGLAYWNANVTHNDQQLAERYLEVFLSLRRRGRWTSPDVLRYAALALMSCGIDDRAVPEVIEIAAVLRKQGGWTSPMRSAVRTVMAAIIHRRELDALEVSDSVERYRLELPRHGLRKGGASAALACFILALEPRANADERHLVLTRLAEIHAGWREDHPVITQMDDYPAAAIFAMRGLPPTEIARRTESIFTGLRGLGIGGLARNALQYSAQILALGDLDEPSAVEAFRRCVSSLRDAGLRISANSWDEVASLCLSGPNIEAATLRCLRLKKALLAAPKRPNRQLAFTIATGLVLADCERREQVCDDVRDLTSLIAAQRLIDAQEAA